MICPDHIKTMLFSETKYGPRLACPIAGCTMVSWNGSLPADKSTRQARMNAHAVFDPIWKDGKVKRKKLYAELADYMGLKVSETHIGQFDKIQCESVEWFVNTYFKEIKT